MDISKKIIHYIYGFFCYKKGDIFFFKKENVPFQNIRNLIGKPLGNVQIGALLHETEAHFRITGI